MASSSAGAVDLTGALGSAGLCAPRLRAMRRIEVVRIMEAPTLIMGSGAAE